MTYEVTSIPRGWFTRSEVAEGLQRHVLARQLAIAGELAESFTTPLTQTIVATLAPMAKLLVRQDAGTDERQRELLDPTRSSLVYQDDTAGYCVLARLTQYVEPEWGIAHYYTVVVVQRLVPGGPEWDPYEFLLTALRWDSAAKLWRPYDEGWLVPPGEHSNLPDVAALITNHNLTAHEVIASLIGHGRSPH